MSPSILYVAALAFTATVAAVSNLQAPASPTANSNVTITWSSDSSDTGPMTLTVSSADTNQTFSGGLAIANNVNPQDNQITVVFPQVISPGTYTLSLVSASDASDVLASSSTFAVGAAPAASSAASSTKSGSASSATATAPSSSVSASLSSAAASISSAASSAASSARSVASSALSSIASVASSASSASSSASQSSSAGRIVSLTWAPGASLALAMVLGGMAVGAVAL
ncbi:hypothetical protein B0H13DRAFT_2656099 [Mycena leptocephala]|nr:hypothetical protein B0H13DRAFT_2656099 [Mycena leptocephala]